jgi:hypothetical protein
MLFQRVRPVLRIRPLDYDPNLPLYRTLDFGPIPFACDPGGSRRQGAGD